MVADSKLMSTPSFKVKSSQVSDLTPPNAQILKQMMQLFREPEVERPKILTPISSAAPQPQGHANESDPDSNARPEVHLPRRDGKYLWPQLQHRKNMGQELGQEYLQVASSKTYTYRKN